MAYEDAARPELADRGVRFQRNPEFIFRQIVNEAVLVPIHQPVDRMDCIYTLNEVGAFVWQQLDRPATQAELLRAILHDYEADDRAVAQDLSCFLLQMVDIDAIRCTAGVAATRRLQNV